MVGLSAVVWSNVIAVAVVTFAPALMFTLWKSVRLGQRLVPLTTSIPTALALWAITIADANLGPDFLLATITSAITSMVWTCLAIYPGRGHG